MSREAPRDQLLEELTGIKSSRRTFYTAYREKELRLNHAIASITEISAALCHTTSGVLSLAQAVVRAAAQHFEAIWTVLALNDTTVQQWVAYRNSDDTLVFDRPTVPAALDEAIRQVLEQQRFVVGGFAGGRRILGAPMFLRDKVVGALVVVLNHSFTLDERETSVLQTLANQAAVATENARLYEEVCRQKNELEEKNRQLERARHWLALARQNEIVNNERSRIARDLHDSVAQHLISIGMNLEWCRAQLCDRPALYERISDIKELARSAITHIRAAIFELSTLNGSQSSLIGALHNLVTDFEKNTHLLVQLRVPDDPRLLPAEVRHALYYIAQEALFNAYKHAKATTVSIEVRLIRGAVHLVVSDDGVGIPKKYLHQACAQLLGSETRHFGLYNMYERARELGGKLRISHGRRGGTEVCVTIPLPTSNGAHQHAGDDSIIDN